MSADARESPELTSYQERTILALLDSPSIAMAARKVGVNEKTVRRWLKEPEFVAAYREARRQQWEQSIAVASRFATKASTTLAAALDSDNPHARIRAAKVLHDITARAVDLLDVEQRLTEVERRLDGEQT